MADARERTWTPPFYSCSHLAKGISPKDSHQTVIKVINFGGPLSLKDGIFTRKDRQKLVDLVNNLQKEVATDDVEVTASDSMLLLLPLLLVSSLEAVSGLRRGPQRSIGELLLLFTPSPWERLKSKYDLSTGLVRLRTHEI